MAWKHWCLAVVLTLGTAGVQGAEPKPIPLYAAPKPVAEGMRESVAKDAAGRTVIRNVTEPALTPFFPKRGRANGASVIVIPGGGFMYLSWDSEGTMVAQRLAEKGVTAFVLKYRLDKTPDDKAAYEQMLRERILKYAQPQTEPRSESAPSPAVLAAAEDAGAAIRLIRGRAGEWKLDPERIGVVGFSAGAITAAYAATASSDRPDFAGIIYGALDRPVPKDAPPVFIAASVDDGIMTPEKTIGIFNAWRAAGRPAELHLFEGGGHGYGMVPNGKTSDHWFDEFVWWLESRKLFSANVRNDKAPALKPGVIADLTGKWAFAVTSGGGTTTPTATLEQKGESVTGTFHSQVLGDCKVTGTLQKGIYTMTVESALLTLVYTGAAETRDSLKGTVSHNGQPFGTFTAKRQ